MSQPKFLLRLYDKVMQWSQHPKATRYLAFVSFIDASIFPISPTFMALPMSFATPQKSFYFAAIAIISSFFGGILGYYLGYFCFEAFLSYFIEWMGYSSYYVQVVDWFNIWGFWAVFVGCFTPIIPYKIFTISAGVLQLHLGLFLLASLAGRSVRFLMIATLIYWGGARVEPFLRKALCKLSGS